MYDPKKRQDFMFFTDIQYGNPNGDPDNDNDPRTDPRTKHGLISDVSINRKVRNYVQAVKEGEEGYGVLYQAGPSFKKVMEGINDSAKDNSQSAAEYVLRNYWDARALGAVLTGSEQSEGIKGSIHIGTGVSVDPVDIRNHEISRVCHNEKDDRGTFGNKSQVVYGLYKFTGSYSPHKSTMTEKDLRLFWSTFEEAFDLDRSANRHLHPRILVVFEHEGPLGSRVASHRLYERVKVQLKDGVEYPLSFQDYEVSVDEEGLQEMGVTLHKVFGC